MQDNRYYRTDNWVRPNFDQNQFRSQSVIELIKEVEANGAKSIIELSKRFDGFSPTTMKLMPFELYPISEDLSLAIRNAANRIERFCQFQQQSLVDQEYTDATGRYSYCYKPIKRIGAYIPGGRFPLISTALMTLIPAKVAGCEERIACSPSDHPAILAAASLAGATSFIKIGGVQAIAAMALGFEDVSPVSMIVGPGNQYVNAAKQYFQARLAIDVSAGPSELLILADDKANIDWLIKDMAAQAEHDPLANSVFVTDQKSVLDAVFQVLNAHGELQQLYLQKQINLVLAQSIEDMIEFADNYAPEHLLLADNRIQESQLNNYGAIFVGENSAVAFGDYCSGPNHTLPTMGSAKYSSGLSVASFLKIQTLQEVNDNGRLTLGKIASALAEAEQLVWHKRSIEVRS